MRPKDPRTVMGRRQHYTGPPRSLRPKSNGSVVTLVIDNNHDNRRALKKALGKGFVVKRRDGPEPNTSIEDRPCSECGCLMREHDQETFACPQHLMTTEAT